MINNSKIKTWKQFAKHVRSMGCNLLKRLDEFQNSVLITGCQRSGTTILCRVINQSDCMVKFWFGEDDELDGALILAGCVQHNPKGRYCFQTTYLNECYHEYFKHNNGHKIIWVLRNPFSVVYSLVYNWRRWALNELFCACGIDQIEKSYKWRYERFGVWGLPTLIKACLAYKGKLLQMPELLNKLGADSMMVIDYDSMVNETDKVLGMVYDYIEIPYKEFYGNTIHRKSVKKKILLSSKEEKIIRNLCYPLYEEARSYISIG